MQRKNRWMLPRKSVTDSACDDRSATVALAVAIACLPAAAFGPPPNATLSLEKLSRIDDFLNARSRAAKFRAPSS